MDATQEAVLAFLADPATHGGEGVKRIDTHAAIIFLAGPRALKVKRAVRFPFLDYSTLDLRKDACEAELRINRPLAAQIYWGSCPLPASATALSRSAARAHRSNGRSRCAVSTKTRLSTIWSPPVGSMSDLADALGRAVAAAQEF